MQTRKCRLIWNAFGLLLICAAFSCGNLSAAASERDHLEINSQTLEDKIRGGLLGQLLGNLNGLPHEFKYLEQPGDVRIYTPALPEGARTDDDTDIEWVYVCAMEKSDTLFIPPAQIAHLWKSHINDHIWCANRYARSLMDIGIDPPLTGYIAFNPWADFNISGQFLCESFGLVAPGMPQSAARLGLHYVRVGIEGEPAQTTQMFTTMIAMAFVTDDINEILDAGLKAIDQRSEITTIVRDVLLWHREHPADWRATRARIQKKYAIHGGGMRDNNGYELNTAGTIAALLYGGGDFVETLRVAFNFGWDCDNNAATAATIIGVIKGHAWMQNQGWDIKDRYRNTTRANMPEDETITRFGNRLIRIAERLIVENRGHVLTADGQKTYLIKTQTPANSEPLCDPGEKLERLKVQFAPKIRALLHQYEDEIALARAAYMAVCLDLAEEFRLTYPDQWKKAAASLGKQTLIKVLYNTATPAGARLQSRMRAAGVNRP
ncbi:MAG: ADP-ribosylglycohydrolase family protein [Phycisphaerae bacterium]|nr:ADP-ribosylglycohydrolase family protein [Phycisphaerae bacterium]